MVFDFFLLRDIENNLYLAGFIKANWSLEMLVLCTLKYDSLHVHVKSNFWRTFEGLFQKTVDQHEHVKFLLSISRILQCKCRMQML